ncbi:MAG: response regulator [bacterium]
MSKQNVLLIEDLPDMQEWLESAIAEAFPDSSVAVAGNVSEGIGLIDNQSFDVALVDLGLPDGTGLQILQHLKKRDANTLAVVVTTFSDDEHLFGALQSGADGYVLKDMGPAHIATMLTECAAGRPPLSPAIARRVIASFHPPTDTGLTPRQEEVLSLIGKGCSITEVASLLEISAHTVHGYIKDIYRQLGIHSRAEAAGEARRLGLVH